jgi:hypothetical protein
VGKGGLALVENNTSNIIEDDYKDKILNGMKENLLLSIISFLWNKIIESDSHITQDKENFQKAFIKSWKENINEITQMQLKQINKVLNESNIDILNLITGKKEIADVEDYQEILNKSISEIEEIYWKICGK